MGRKSLPIYLSIFLLIFAGLVCGVLLVSSSSKSVPPPPTIAASARGSNTSAPPASSAPATNPSQPSPTVRTPKPTPDLRGLSPAALAKALIEAPDLNYAVAATEQALARGGIATSDLQTILVPAVKPAASSVATPSVALHLAFEARQRASAATATVDDVGNMLKDFGFPFAAGRTPGQHLLAFLSAWDQQAQKAPDDPESFNILFIAEMVKHQVPAADLASGTAQPGDVRLSLLEMELFAAGFDRALNQQASDDAGPRLAERSVSPRLSQWIDVLVPAAEAADEGGPCGWLNKLLTRLGTTAHLVGGAGLAIAPGHLIGLLEEHEFITEETAAAAEEAIQALGAAARIWQMIAAYRDSQVSVELMSGSPSLVHKPLGKDTPVEMRPHVGFIARAGISEADWEDYENSLTHAFDESSAGEAIRDCLESIGLPTTSTGDVAKDLDKWSVRWSIVEGNQHADMDVLRDPGDWDTSSKGMTGRIEQNLKRTGDHSAEGKMWVYPRTEEVHDTAVLKQAPVTVRADVNTSPGLNIHTFVSTAEGAASPLALARALIDVAAGWVQTMVPLKAYATITVEWHEPGTFILELDSQTHYVAKEGAMTWDSHVQADVPIKLDKDSNMWKGSGPIKYIHFAVTAGSKTGCTISGQPTGGMFHVNAASIDLVPPPGDTSMITMTVDTFEPTENLTMTCPGVGSWNTSAQSWGMMYLNAHRIQNDAVLTNWTVLENPKSPIFAQKIYKRSVPFVGGIIDENTIFDLKRTDQ